MANSRRRLVGRVVSDKMDKTVVVAIDVRKLHPIYKKVVRETKKLVAHDESNSVPVGAIVRVVESRPMSKTKRWVVEEVIEAKDFATLETLADEAILTGGDVEAEAGVEAVAGEAPAADAGESEAAE